MSRASGSTAEGIDPAAAAQRLAGVVRRTPLVAFPSGDPRVELRLKLECLQETSSFKARGAWNQISQLTEAGRAAGVVATSSGNHAQAVAWAAKRAGVRAILFMPADAYPNKIEACRGHGAEVLLCATREEAESACAAAVAAGAVLIHPYAAARTIEGAGTVGLEIAEDWPQAEVVIFPVGGGGLITGGALALRARLGARVRIFGVEPAGARNLALSLEAGRPVTLERIDTRVQGLCPLDTGVINVAVCTEHVDAFFALTDEQILAAQARLVRAGGWTVEPAGAAAAALVFAGGLPAGLLDGRSGADPLRVAAVISGGNPDPAQLRALQA